MSDPSDGWADAWRRFQSGPTTLGPTPGARESWHRGRPWYSAWILRIDAPAARARLALAAAALGDRIRPLPPADAHLTLWVSGFPADPPRLDDDVSPAALAAQAARLAAAGLPPPALSLGGLGAFLTCAFLEVSDPRGDLARLRALLAAGAPEIRFAPYQPHLTVGTFPSSEPTAPISASIAPLRDLPPLPLSAAAVERVEFAADQPGAPLITRVRIPFRA